MLILKAIKSFKKE